MKPNNYGQWVKPTEHNCERSNGGCDCDGGFPAGYVDGDNRCSLIGYVNSDNEGSLTGFLDDSNDYSLTGYLNRAPTIIGTLNINDCADGVPIYPGPYEVTPHSYEQVLDTARQMMTDDVTVHEIPYWETSNLSDGLTAYIGN